MKKIVYVFLLNIILLFPIFINAETYEKAEEISNSYMNRTDFKNSYNKYIYIQNANKFGDLITKEEFVLTTKNIKNGYENINYSYLWDSRPF